MLRRAVAFLLLMIAAGTPARAQGIEARCFGSDTSGDAIINCLKAMVALERKQLQLLAELRRVVVKGTNGTAKTAANTALAARQLEDIAGLLRGTAGRPSEYLFVSDLAPVGGSQVACDYGEPEQCVDPARQAADAICIRLGYQGQHAHEFAGPDGSDRLIRVKWVVCRP